MEENHFISSPDYFSGKKNDEWEREGDWWWCRCREQHFLLLLLLLRLEASQYFLLALRRLVFRTRRNENDFGFTSVREMWENEGRRRRRTQIQMMTDHCLSNLASTTSSSSFLSVVCHFCIIILFSNVAIHFQTKSLLHLSNRIIYPLYYYL